MSKCEKVKQMLEENFSEFLYNLRVGKTFPTLTENPKVTKELITFDYINTDNFHIAKCIRSKVK